jgi:hypothetical protein
MEWMLVDYISDQTLSRHPNEQGAMLSALRHVQNGQKIDWQDSKTTVQVAGHYGVVDGYRRFKTQAY